VQFEVIGDRFNLLNGKDARVTGDVTGEAVLQCDRHPRLPFFADHFTDLKLIAFSQGCDGNGFSDRFLEDRSAFIT